MDNTNDYPVFNIYPILIFLLKFTISVIIKIGIVYLGFAVSAVIILNLPNDMIVFMAVLFGTGLLFYPVDRQICKWCLVWSDR